MKIELKNVAHSPSLSDDSEAFTATVYIDGVKATTVKDGGYGGSLEFGDWKVCERINEYAKTLPQYEHDLGNGDILKGDQNAETLIGELLNDYLQQKKLKKILSSHIAYTITGKQGVYQTKKYPAKNIAHWLSSVNYEKTKKTLNAEIILNSLDFTKALEIFKKEAV